MEYQLTHQEITPHKHDRKLKLLVDDLQSPANYGMMIRAAEAMGVEEIIFFSQDIKTITTKIKRSSRSAEKYIRVRFTQNLEEELEKFKKEKLEIIGLEYTSHSKNIKNHQFSPAPKVLVCGNESTGLSKKIISQCDFCVHLPMFGENSSMNVVMATSIALWELVTV